MDYLWKFFIQEKLVLLSGTGIVEPNIFNDIIQSINDICGDEKDIENNLSNIKDNRIDEN